MKLSEIEDDLFIYNLSRVAEKFGLCKNISLEFAEDKACKLLNLAEQYSNEPSDEYRYKSLLITALVWENRKDNWIAIGPFISRILIRLGLGTSAKMVNWNNQFNQFNSLGSFIEELYSSANLSSHEIDIAGQTLILSDFQKRMWDSISKYSVVGISAPTSAGKSFVLVNKAIDTLLNSEGCIFFIVPTISLISQVSNDLRKKIKELNIDDIEIAQTVNDISLFNNSKIIYVLTQERAFSALNHPEANFKNIQMLIIDEVQNIEKVPNEEEERAKILFDVIQIFKNDIKPKKIILAGPRLEKLDEVIKKWFGGEAMSVSEELPAVLNITYTFKPKRGKLLFVQYISKKIFHSIEINDTFRLKEKILKRQKFEEEENDLFALIINQNKIDGTIIFADTTNAAVSIAKGIAPKLDNTYLSQDTDSFVEFIKNTVHPKYALLEALKKGIAYHHSKMPPHIRILVEKLFINRKLTSIVATTTLMQGVNLPAKNIIIKSPKVGADNLTGYEFTNLKGRAGRLMQDFVGRALIVNEGLCTAAGIELDISQQKELVVGYAKRYQAEKEIINQLLISNLEMNEGINNDLVTYVRNMFIRYNDKAKARLNEVGIILSDSILENISKQVDNLEVPKTICLNNFYWDPLILNRLYLSVKSGAWPLLPTSIVSSTNVLRDCILQMAEFAPLYFKRYFKKIELNDSGKKKIYSLAIFAENYGRGLPLKDVIDPFAYPVENSDDIDTRIGDLQTKVVYGIPKLLKPLFQINDIIYNEKASAILSFIEIGGMENRLRTLIEIGVPRETAIELIRKISDNRFMDEEGKVDSKSLKRFILNSKESDAINKWHKLIIQDL